MQVFSAPRLVYVVIPFGGRQRCCLYAQSPAFANPDLESGAANVPGLIISQARSVRGPRALGALNDLFISLIRTSSSCGVVTRALFLLSLALGSVAVNNDWNQQLGVRHGPGAGLVRVIVPARSISSACRSRVTSHVVRINANGIKQR